ncbi:putative serine/threonine-protein kinase [Penaeus vannamei]|uniref:Putative serine/threonine-protein kinase n=1 Tax=Penaeus vannamei TaxID=6689 RepID=A0A3R7QN03_PENVA|nr:putative serine/threonine-protein kinase [Penaeus vannamei]
MQMTNPLPFRLPSSGRPGPRSLGVLTYVLLTGFLPFGGETDQETFLEISLGELDFPEELFEDVSAEAIDFIKKLLIRKPHLRMSAKECLEHPWMKADLSKAKIPPQPPRKLSSSTSPLTTSTPVASPQPRSAVPSTSSTPTNQTLISALSDIVTSDARDLFNRSHGSHSNTPVVHTPANATPTVLTPNNTTPTVLTPMSSSPRDIGLPPIHPLSGQRSSAVNSTYSSTNSLYRGGSRQSLDRARSLSKSREVLFERMQMSNQKKTLSKSRERLYDGRLSLSRSREDIWSYKSFSHSEESLSMFSWLNQDDSIYKSCNNVFLPMLPMLEENGMSGRLYKSLASIDKIDEVGTESNAGNDRQGIFDSRFSINDEDYNNLITRYNTAVNSHRESPPRGRSMEERPRRTQAEGWHRECCQGERGGASVCDRRCSRSSRQQEPQITPKIPKTNRGERDKQRMERTTRGMHAVEHETSKSTERASASARAPSPGKRRGSVSHIEQRIQERHERQQERLERQEQKEKLERRGSGKIGTPTTKRRNSAEEKKPQGEKNRKNKTCESTKSNDTNVCNRLRSTSPSKKPKVNKSKSISSDGSPASSLESVKELDLKRTTPRSSAFREPKKSPRGSTSGGASSAPEPRERRAEMDEAYVSLEEPVDDGIFSRSESMDSSNTVESDHTVHATDTSSDTLDLTVTAYSVSEYELNQECDISDVFPSLDENEVDKTVEEKAEDQKSTITSVKASSSESMAELTAIHEEEEDEKSVFTRSVSTSSDIGSMLSESSEVEKDDSSTKNQDSDASAALSWRQRGRSMSMQPCDPPPFSHLHLCRSNSFNLVMPIGGFVATPWGDVCDGAIRRALEMFKLNSSDLTSSGRNMQERRSSLHTPSPSPTPPQVGDRESWMRHRFSFKSAGTKPPLHPRPLAFFATPCPTSSSVPTFPAIFLSISTHPPSPSTPTPSIPTRLPSPSAPPHPIHSPSSTPPTFTSIHPPSHSNPPHPFHPPSPSRIPSIPHFSRTLEHEIET